MQDPAERLDQDGTVVLESFASSEGEPVAWIFRDPVETVEARTADELQYLLHRVQDATDRGSYAAGYLPYEAGYALEPASARNEAPHAPLGWFGIYNAPQVLHLDQLLELLPDESFEVVSPHFEYERADYSRLFERVRGHVREGDVYQINLTGRLRFRFRGSDLGLYRALFQEQRRVYGAYIRVGNRTILSRSPELFVSRDGMDVTVRPMKGTARRGRSAEEDESLRRNLASDPKSRAENLMIVDLLRNDLSVVCEPDTVRVSELFSTEIHETLIQMTSTVRGKLRPGTTWADQFRALFPCGSVTGAPRIRAMQLIREMERSPRGVYCGAIGWMGPGDRAVFSVAIRTAEIEGDLGQLGIGSGLVWDSDEQGEYDECLLKARFFLNAVGVDSLGGSRSHPFQLIETMRWQDGISLLPLHLARLRQSAALLEFEFDEDAILSAIQDATSELGDGPHRVRLLLDENGDATISAAPLDESPTKPLRIALAEGMRRSDDPLARHKTTERKLLDRLHEEVVGQGFDEVVLLNERGEVCEGTRSNLLIRSRGSIVTPPVASGLLPGVYRTYLMQTRTDVREEVLTVADLVRAEQIFLCNAVWGMREAQLAIDDQTGIPVFDRDTIGLSSDQQQTGEPAIRDDISTSTYT